MNLLDTSPERERAHEIEAVQMATQQLVDYATVRNNFATITLGGEPLWGTALLEGTGRMRLHDFGGQKASGHGREEGGRPPARWSRMERGAPVNLLADHGLKVQRKARNHRSNDRRVVDFVLHTKRKCLREVHVGEVLNRAVDWAVGRRNGRCHEHSLTDSIGEKLRGIGTLCGVANQHSWPRIEGKAETTTCGHAGVAALKANCESSFRDPPPSVVGPNPLEHGADMRAPCRRSTLMGYVNPLLKLPDGRKLIELPAEQRAPLEAVLRELRDQANTEAENSWRKRKGPMVAYWRAVATYARHLAHALSLGGRRSP
ncbi:hypothetical protein ACSFBI_18045 [Variovorax sp. RB3P1]|uniref:hypothetical protein n=1 Tax=Variovorax sp. RB3P1 TaxID=3443732 RepID=UPI003F47288C